MSDDYKLEELVKTYLTIRTARDNLLNEYELKDSNLKQDMKQLEQVMLEACNSIGADSIKTGDGTIIKTLKEDFECGDWESFKEFITNNNLTELLQQRIHKTNLKEYLATHEGEGLPPGISKYREFGIVIKKPDRRTT